MKIVNKIIGVNEYEDIGDMPGTQNHPTEKMLGGGVHHK